MELRVIIYWDTTSVVLYSDGVVFIDCDLDMCAVACHCFVDRVVDCFVYEVVESFFGDVSYVHGWTFTYCL